MLDLTIELQVQIFESMMVIDMLNLEKTNSLLYDIFKLHKLYIYKKFVKNLGFNNVPTILILEAAIIELQEFQSIDIIISNNITGLELAIDYNYNFSSPPHEYSPYDD